MDFPSCFVKKLLSHFHFSGEVFASHNLDGCKNITDNENKWTLSINGHPFTENELFKEEFMVYDKRHEVTLCKKNCNQLSHLPPYDSNSNDKSNRAFFFCAT